MKVIWKSSSQERSPNTCRASRKHRTERLSLDSHTSSHVCREASCCQSESLFFPFSLSFFFLKRLSQKIPRTEKGHKSCLPRHSCFPRKSKFIKTRCMKCTLHFACFCWQVYFLGPWALMISISLSLQISWVYSTNHSLSIWNTVLKSKHEKQSLWVPFWRRQVWPVEHGLRSSCVWKRTPKSSDRTATFSFLETHNQAKKKKKKRPVHGIQLFSWRLHHSFF